MARQLRIDEFQASDRLKMLFGPRHSQGRICSLALAGEGMGLNQIVQPNTPLDILNNQNSLCGFLGKPQRSGARYRDYSPAIIP